MGTFHELRARGFVEQCSNEDAVAHLLDNEIMTFYAGFDPTGDSLHVGHLLPIMAMAHMQHGGHKPIVILGGGTALIGDPSGKTEIRKIISEDQIAENLRCMRPQFERFLSLDSGKGVMVDNAEWLRPLNYITFLRDIGRFFKVNEMIKLDSAKQRLEREEGLSFIEFNYQLLQAYDFLVLFQQYECTLQIGGNDQWGNIVAGMDLIRRVESRPSYGLTFPLIMTATGNKMGKTEKGAVWLDAQKTSPYDYFQFWVNTHDADVHRFLGFFTFLPLEEIAELGKLKGADLRHAKQILAFEATKLAHGEEEAIKAKDTATAIFAGGTQDDSSIPTTEITKDQLTTDPHITELFVLSGLATSRSDARRLINGGGAYLNSVRITDTEVLITTSDFTSNQLMLRSGKKKHHRILLSEE